MKYLAAIREQRKLPRFDTGGPVLGSINPNTGQPYTREEISTYYNIGKQPNSNINPISGITGTSSFLNPPTLTPVDTKITSVSSSPFKLYRPKSLDVKPLGQNSPNTFTGGGESYISPENTGLTEGLTDAAESGMKIDKAGLGQAVMGVTNLAGNFITDKSTSTSKKDALGNELTTRTKLGGAGGGALKGAGIGAQIDIATGGATMGLGTAIGAVAGGVAGLVGTKKLNKEAEEQKKEASKTANTNSNNAAVNYGTLLESQGLGTKGNPYATMFKRGGLLKHGGSTPQYEVEQGEVVQGTDTSLEEQTDLASDMTLAGGDTHENGGTMGQGGERVFSDRIPIGENLYLLLSASGIKCKGNPTYAEVAKKLGVKKGKYEENLNSPDPYKNKTARVMTERIDGLIEATFQEQELLKQEKDMNQPMLKRGGNIPKYAYGDAIDKVLPVITDNSGQIINAAVYANNLRNINKQGTNIRRTTAVPLLRRNTNFLSQNLNEIDKTVDAVSKNVDRNSSNPQDSYARKASMVANSLDAKNKAVQTQAMMDNETTNINNAMMYDYNNRVAENLNADNIDRLINKNSILANRTNASNSFIQGVMGNIASNRSYAIDKEKNAIARMDSDRGTGYRSAKTLLKDPNLTDETRRELQDVVDRYEATPRKAYGGKLPRKMKSYC